MTVSSSSDMENTRHTVNGTAFSFGTLEAEG